MESSSQEALENLLPMIQTNQMQDYQVDEGDSNR